MNIIKRIMMFIENIKVNRNIRKLSESEKIKDFGKTGEEAKIPKRKIPTVLKTIGSKDEAVEAVIENDENLIPDIAAEISPKVYGKNQESIRDKVVEGNPNAFLRIINSEGIKAYEELYKVAGNEKISTYELYDLITKSLNSKNGLVYDTKVISEIIGRKLANIISSKEIPLQQHILMETLQTNEEKLELPEYVKIECDKLIKRLSGIKNIPSKKIENLNNFNPDEMRKKIKEQIEANRDLKKEQDKRVEARE